MHLARVTATFYQGFFVFSFRYRRLLFTEGSVLQHDLGEGILSFHPYLHHEEAASVKPVSENSCSSYFIEPVEWMEEMVKSGEVTSKVS